MKVIELWALDRGNMKSVYRSLNSSILFLRSCLSASSNGCSLVDNVSFCKGSYSFVLKKKVNFKPNQVSLVWFLNIVGFKPNQTMLV